MAELDAKLFREYFGGRWACEVFRNGEFVRKLVVTRSGVPGRHFSSGTNAMWMQSTEEDVADGPGRAELAGWHSDNHRWCDRWYNEFGGYGELSWSSQSVVNGRTVLYGTVHECECEGDDPADYIAMCELIDQDSFKYTIQSYQKGILEIVASRVITEEELAGIRDGQAKA